MFACQAAQITKPKYDNFPNPVLGTVPVELPKWNCPWSRERVLQCKFYETSTYVMSVNIYCFLPSQALFKYKIQATFKKNDLKGIAILNHGGTAPGRKGQCFNALGVCIISMHLFAFLHLISVLQLFFARFGAKNK